MSELNIFEKTINEYRKLNNKIIVAMDNCKEIEQLKINKVQLVNHAFNEISIKHKPHLELLMEHLNKLDDNFHQKHSLFTSLNLIDLFIVKQEYKNEPKKD